MGKQNKLLNEGSWTNVMNGTKKEAVNVIPEGKAEEVYTSRKEKASERKTFLSRSWQMYKRLAKKRIGISGRISESMHTRVCWAHGQWVDSVAELWDVQESLVWGQIEGRLYKVPILCVSPMQWDFLKGFKWELHDQTYVLENMTIVIT